MSRDINTRCWLATGRRPSCYYYWLTRLKIAIPADIFFEMVWMCGRQFKDSSIWTPRDLCLITLSKGVLLTLTVKSLFILDNDRSLMRFAIIMQHANMAYRVQRAYKGPTIWLLWGGERGGMGDFREKTSWSLILSTRKIFQGNICHTIALYVREKYSTTRGSGKKKFLRKPIKSPIPRSNGRPLSTCRKSGYRLILRLRRQSLIVHSRSKLATARRVQHRRQARYFLNLTKNS